MNAFNAFRDKSREWTLITGASNGVGQKFSGPVATKRQGVADNH